MPSNRHIFPHFISFFPPQIHTHKYIQLFCLALFPPLPYLSHRCLVAYFYCWGGHVKITVKQSLVQIKVKGRNSDDAVVFVIFVAFIVTTLYVQRATFIAFWSPLSPSACTYIHTYWCSNI